MKVLETTFMPNEYETLRITGTKIWKYLKRLSCQRVNLPNLRKIGILLLVVFKNSNH